LSDTPVVTASSCQNCDWRHFLASGEAMGEAIRRSGLREPLSAYENARGTGNIHVWFPGA